MRRLYLLMTLIVGIMIVSCNPKEGSDGDDNMGGGSGHGNHGGSADVYEYVDLGLPSGLKWAACNVGASSPEECGDYFAWGETTTKGDFCAGNSLTYGKDMNDISGNVQYDAATANWGGGWRMPTKAEQQELLDNCTWTWIQEGGINGYKVTGANGNSIFLPAAGYHEGASIFATGVYGHYWASTPDEYDENNAYSINFDSSDIDVHCNYTYRYYGWSVRPVVE